MEWMSDNPGIICRESKIFLEKKGVESIAAVHGPCGEWELPDGRKKVPNFNPVVWDQVLTDS